MAPDRLLINENLRKWLYASIGLFVASFLLMCSFATYSIIRGQQVNAALCRTADDNRTILGNILNVSEDQMLSTAQDVTERNIIRQRFNELRALIPPLKCTVKGGPQELEP